MISRVTISIRTPPGRRNTRAFPRVNAQLTVNVSAAFLPAGGGPEHPDHRHAVDCRSGEDGIAHIQASDRCG